MTKLRGVAFEDIHQMSENDLRSALLVAGWVDAVGLSNREKA